MEPLRVEDFLRLVAKGLDEEDGILLSALLVLGGGLVDAQGL